MANTLQIYRQGQEVLSIPIDENTIYLDECMGRFEIAAQLQSSHPLDIRVDDYIIYNGVRFTVNVPYQIYREGTFMYSITFEHPSYWLKDISFKQAGDIEFSFFGTPRECLQLIVDNMNVDDSGWMVGNCEENDPQVIEFFASGGGYSCKGALQRIAEEFELEYWFSGDGKTINITKQAGAETNIHFQYGRAKGLYSVERGVLDTPLYNRVYGFGGSTNIGLDYRGGAKRLVFDGRFIERPLMEGERRRETSVVFDEIFPERTGEITDLSSDWLTITDSSIDFDLNGNAIEGESAKVLFKSGQLGGRTFDISYDHPSRSFRLVPNTESNGESFPNSQFHPSIGDTYSFVNIYQPQSYIDNAERKLLEATQNVFKQQSRPPYRVDIDEKYMRENAFSLKSGDRVRLIDTELSIDDKIRATSVSFPMVNPSKCTVVISDKITYTREAETIIDHDKIKDEVKVVDRRKSEEQRRQAVRMRQLQEMTFDPDGYFDTDRIRPESIETLMLSVGAKSQNFYLDGVRIIPNAGDDANAISITPGKLIHREIQIEDLGYLWDLGGFSQEDLDPAMSYYLSAKCSKSQLTGQWVLSETPIEVDAEPGFYHFNCGVLYNVLEDRRDYAFTNGMTYINGDTIRTGKVGADFIDVIGLFAEEITATNMTVTGDSRLGPFSIDDDGLFYAVGGPSYAGRLRVNKDGLLWNGLDGFPNPVPVSASLAIGAGIGVVEVVVDERHSKNVGISIGMGAVDKHAIRIIKGMFRHNEGDYVLGNGDIIIENGNLRVSGSIYVDGDTGETAKIPFLQAYPDGGGYLTRYMNFKGGLFTGITNE